MKIKHQLSVAALVVAGVFATGCSQQSAGGSQVAAGSQQVAGGASQGASQAQVEGASQVAGGSQQQVEPAPVVPAPKPMPKPAPVRPAPSGHVHPAIPNCTDSIRHNHPGNAAQHSHRYSCKGQRRVRNTNRWTHTHPAIPRCTKSIRHTHKYQNARHSHKYSCQGMKRMAPKPQVDVRALQQKLKAKGYYKGPIDGIVGPGTRAALKRFMNR